MVHTWQHHKVATESFHYMTEVIADLEIELKKKGVRVEDLPEPKREPLPDPQPCEPPWNCMQRVAELREYTGQLGAYVNAVLERTTALLTAAMNNNVLEFPYRVIDRPEAPEKTRG